MLKRKKSLFSFFILISLMLSFVVSTGVVVSADSTISISTYSDLAALFVNTTATPKTVTGDYILTADITVPSSHTPLGSIVPDSIANPAYQAALDANNALDDADPAKQKPPYNFKDASGNTIPQKLDSGLVTFKGTLDGNGHKITLQKDSLFKSIDSSAIKNLAFTQVATQNNVVSSTAVNSTMTNCYAYSSTLTPKIDLTGITNSTVFTCTGERTKYEFWRDTSDNSLNILTVPDYKNSEYEINNTDEWNVIAKLINAGTSSSGTSLYSADNYAITQDIFMTSANPLITWAIDAQHKFTGTFNGQGYTINAGQSKQLFGFIEKASISNLGVHIAEVSGNTSNEYVGGIVGNAINNSTLSKCYFVGKSSSSKFGGLVGSLDNATVSKCYTRTTTEVGGGFANYMNAGKFNSCYTTQGKVALTLGNNNEFNFCYASASSLGASGVTVVSTDEMKKANFVATLNKNDPKITDFVFMNNQAPGLTGIGEGKNPGAPVQYYKVTIKDPIAGCTFSVYDGTKYLKTGDLVAKGTSLTFSNKNTIGYVFATYKIDGSSYPNSQYVVNSDVTVEAEFNVIEVYTISVKTTKGGTITPADAAIKVNKGDTYTFKIIPDAGYKIKSVNYTGAGITKSGDNYTTSIMITNTTLDVAFVSKSENVTNVEVTDKGNVITVKSTLDVLDLLDQNYGNIFKAPLSATKMIEDNVLAAIQGKDVTLILDGGTFTWTINGKSITSSASSINMNVKLEGGTIPDKYLNQVSAYTDKKQFQLAHTGPFPFTAKLTLNVGQNQAGRYANLFYYNPNKLQLEIINSSKIDKDGNTSFTFTHASDYVIVMADKVLTTKDLSMGAGVLENMNPLFSGNGTALLLSFLLLLAVVGGGLIVWCIIKKCNKSY